MRRAAAVVLGTLTGTALLVGAKVGNTPARRRRQLGTAQRRRRWWPAAAGVDLPRVPTPVPSGRRRRHRDATARPATSAAAPEPGPTPARRADHDGAQDRPHPTAGSTDGSYQVSEAVAHKYGTLSHDGHHLRREDHRHQSSSETKSAETTAPTPARRSTGGAGRAERQHRARQPARRTRPTAYTRRLPGRPREGRRAGRLRRVGHCAGSSSSWVRRSASTSSTPPPGWTLADLADRGVRLVPRGGSTGSARTSRTARCAASAAASCAASSARRPAVRCSTPCERHVDAHRRVLRRVRQRPARPVRLRQGLVGPGRLATGCARPVSPNHCDQRRRRHPGARRRRRTAARGGSASGHPWQADKVAWVVAGTDLAVATSGTYERGHHVLDPFTGGGAGPPALGDRHRPGPGRRRRVRDRRAGHGPARHRLAGHPARLRVARSSPRTPRRSAPPASPQSICPPAPPRPEVSGNEGLSC